MILGILRLLCTLSFASHELATVLVQVLENVRGARAFGLGINVSPLGGGW